MLTRLLRASLPALVAGTWGLQLARADIYTWVDASGTINVSNLAPPEGVAVTRVTHASERGPPTSDDAARAAAQQSEMQALAERVGQLEAELELAQRPLAPPVNYPAIPAPPVMQYADLAPPTLQYDIVSTAPPPIAACDGTWMDCGLGWFPGIYSASVVVLRPSNFRRFHPGYGGHHLAVRQAVRAPKGGRRG
jgi:hypothetical protein